MKKINFFLALCCLVAVLNLQFKKPEYAISKEKVEAYSKKFEPQKSMVVEFGCCVQDGNEQMPTGSTGNNCKTGKTDCRVHGCPRYEEPCVNP